MNLFSISILVFCILVSTSCRADIRPPAVAGSFYPADRNELSFQVDKFLKNAGPPRVKDNIVALVVPHAGYPYSGQVAAHAYKELEGKFFDTVILLGSSHQLGFDRIVVPDCESFATPLGKVPVDREFIGKLRKLSDRVVVDNKVHRDEHSLEVQLPFLQKTLKKEFKIVPLLFGSISLANCQSLAYALGYLVTDSTLIVASTDWSHYYAYGRGKIMDDQGISGVIRGDIEGFVRNLAEGKTEACGAPAVITTMMLAPAMGGSRVELLKYANSGDVTGDTFKVVGYASIVFYREETKLSAVEKKKLLRIARRTLEAKLSGKKLPVFTLEEPALKENRGAFVTLTDKGKLRGCIGYIRPVKPLFLAVQEMAIEAATNDPRFPPVTRPELKELKIEVSVLSRLKRTSDVSEVEVGRDGLYIIKEGRSGLLLPQVAVEWGWDRDEFLKQVCVKAGLPEDAWKKDAALYRFTAEVFHE